MAGTVVHLSAAGAFGPQIGFVANFAFIMLIDDYLSISVHEPSNLPVPFRSMRRKGAGRSMRY